MFENPNSDDKQQLCRQVKSFVLRTGRMTTGQQRGWDKHWPNWGLSKENGTINLSAIFGRSAPAVVEIGFGMGQSLITMAKQEPDKNFIGIEVHRPGVGALLNNAAKENVTNIRVFCDDAVDVLNQCIPDKSLYRVQVYFPDPWHKKKHNKRRLMQSTFVNLLQQKIISSGTLHFATDWEHYAHQMMEILSASPLLKNKIGTHQYAPRPDYRPLTKFEKRGKQLGHDIWDLLFMKL